MLLMMLVAATGGLLCASPAHATTTVNDYPYASSGVDQVDRWNFYTRECTSFVAWRINNDAHVAFTNQYGGVTWGNAGNWANAARQVGVPVDSTPVVGSVAVFPGNVDGAGELGHVAWVTGVGNGTITVEDYNYADSYNGNTYYNYGQHSVATAGLSFIHFGTIGKQGGAETWENPHTGKLLDLDHSNPADGTKIDIFTGNGTNAQYWIRSSWPGGYYKISNRATGKCVDIAGPSKDAGAAVHSWSCYTADSQLWSWVAKGTTFDGWPVYQIHNKFSGKCLAIAGSGTSDGTGLQQQTCTSDWSQEWF
jgi:surface antigen